MRLKEIFINLDLLPNNSQQRALKAKGGGGSVAPLIHKLDAIWWRIVNVTNLPLCPTERDPLSPAHRAVWASGSFWKVVENLAPTGA